MYAHSIDKQPFMTESYKTPVSFDIIRDSDTFEEVVDVQSNEVVLITYANGDLYLNLPKNDKKNDNEDENLVFQPWYDYRDIDLNGWFTIEYDQESDKIHLKHFNTGKYLTVFNKVGIKDIVTLKDEKSENSQLVFDPVDSEEPDIMTYTYDTVFKIKSSPGEADKSESFVRVADENDVKELAGVEDEDDILELEATTERTIPVVVKEECPVNEYDTFNLVFPQANTYRELMFCKDINTYLSNFVDSLNKYHDPLSLCKDNIWALVDIFWSIYAFLQNELEGRIKSEYLVGEIVPYRQKMISKIGIGYSIHSFLEFLTKVEGWDVEDTWEETIMSTFQIKSNTFTKYDNLIDLIFDVIHSLVIENYINKKLVLKNLHILQKFVFVEKLPIIFEVVFRRKRYKKDNEMNKEKIYSRIYEFDKVKPLVDNYVEIMKRTRNRKYLFILRKLCVILEDPLPLVQDYVFKKLYEEDNKGIIYPVKYYENPRQSQVKFRFMIFLI